MSLLLFDGFDSYSYGTDTTLTPDWSETSSAPRFYEKTRYGRATRMVNVSRYNPIAHIFTADQAGKTIYTGFLYTSHEADRIASEYDVLSITEGTTRDSAVQWMLTVDNGYFKIYRGDKTTLLATGTHQLLYETNYHIQIKFLVHNTTGLFELKIGDNITEISLTNIDLQQQATDSVQMYQFGYESGWFDESYVDNVYICNSDGTKNNGYLGEVICHVLAANADTATADWTTSTGVDHYAVVDDLWYPTTTDYVYSTVSGDKDKFDLENLPFTATSVIALRAEAADFKTYTDYAALKIITTSGGTDQTSSTRISSSNIYLLRDELLTSDGSTTDWTNTTVNSVQITIENAS